MADIVSLLPQLEPVCGVGVAVSIAYLNLERFRYRKDIREHAQALLERLKALSSYNIMQHDEKIALIENLAGLRDNSRAGDLNGANPVAKPLIRSRQRTVYDIIYRFHMDRWICVFFGIVCFLGLCLGAAHAAQSTLWLARFFTSPGQYNFWLIFTSLGTICPLLFVWGGGWIVRSLNNQAKIAFESCEKTLQAAVKKAGLNSTPLPIFTPNIHTRF